MHLFHLHGSEYPSTTNAEQPAPDAASMYEEGGKAEAKMETRDAWALPPAIAAQSLLNI